MATKKKLPEPEPEEADGSPAELVLIALNEYIDTLGDDFDIHDVAIQFRAMVEEEDPVAWEAYAEHHWLAHFEELTRRRLGDLRARKRRAEMRSVAQQRVIEKKLTGMATTAYSVNGNGHYKRLLAMTREDCIFAARRYEKTAATSEAQAAFLRVIARRLKAGQTVADVWTPARFQKVAQQYFGPQTDEALAQIDGEAA